MSPNISNSIDKINNSKNYKKQIKINNKIFVFQKFL